MAIVLPSRNAVTKGRLGGRPFIYNPSEFTHEIGVGYSAIESPGISYPYIGYEGGRLHTISFDIYLNGRGLHKGDDEGAEAVMEWIRWLHSFLPPQNNGKQFRKPPDLEFAFGWFVKITKLANYKARYTMFTPDLRPLEATISVELIVKGLEG